MLTNSEARCDCFISIYFCYSNRVIQHYTSNPLSAYTGKLDTPIVSIHYILQGDQHSGKLGTGSNHVWF